MSEEKYREALEWLISKNFKNGHIKQAEPERKVDRAIQRVRWELSQRKIEADLSRTEQPLP